LKLQVKTEGPRANGRGLFASGKVINFRQRKLVEDLFGDKFP
jgi:hypothetical protein